MRMFINATKGPTQLKLGHPVMADKYDTLGFVLDPRTKAPIVVGTALMTTDVQGTYVPVAEKTVTITGDNVHKVVGFLLGANVMIPKQFPATEFDKLNPGEAGVALVQGTIAVKFVGQKDPKEEDKVYIVSASTDTGYAVGDITDGETVSNVTKVQIVGWRFMGITDTDKGVKVTAIHKGF